ncbi:hypothetical protein [Rodentibacter mrazii]|uniref:hypothetical protein n=1 Tax=Rodentibacter mrazii TaxID=1908257 RepID=UPI00117ACA32|nr:hypothetical protein [Rodentibacter mrazii]
METSAVVFNNLTLELLAMIYLFCGISYQTSGKPYLRLHHIEADNVTQAWNYRLVLPIGQISSEISLLYF